MRNLRVLALLLPVLAGTLALPAQAPAVTLTAADRQGIDATLDAFGDTLTRMDFVTLATLFTDDADFVNIVGQHWTGKAQIVKAHSIVFTTRYHGNPQHIIDRTEALIAPATALVVSTIKMDD